MEAFHEHLTVIVDIIINYKGCSSSISTRGSLDDDKFIERPFAPSSDGALWRLTLYYVLLTRLLNYVVLCRPMYEWSEPFLKYLYTAPQVVRTLICICSLLSS